MKRTTILGVVFVVLVLGYLLSTSFRRQAFRCEVCITYNGRQDCRVGTGETQEAARRTATTTACAQISSGVIQSNQCENTPPDSLKWLQ